MSTPRAITDGIIFRFEEQIKTGMQSGTFKEQTEWGFDLGANFDSTSKKSRWCIVVSNGPDIKDPDIKPGARIFVEALKWTNVFYHNNIQYWKTDESCVMLISTA
jgi:hypothetical protein